MRLRFAILRAYLLFDGFPEILFIVAMALFFFLRLDMTFLLLLALRTSTR